MSFHIILKLEPCHAHTSALNGTMHLRQHEVLEPQEHFFSPLISHSFSTNFQIPPTFYDSPRKTDELP